jgi:hypothetical protein
MNMNVTKLNWVVTATAIALAAIATQSPLFG